MTKISNVKKPVFKTRKAPIRVEPTNPTLEGVLKGRTIRDEHTYKGRKPTKLELAKMNAEKMFPLPSSCLPDTTHSSQVARESMHTLEIKDERMVNYNKGYRQGFIHGNWAMFGLSVVILVLTILLFHPYLMNPPILNP